MKAKKMVKTAYHYRFLLAFLVFILCVVFEISGSSIGLWQDFTGVSTESWNGVLLGKSREIRTDEWAVNTPMAFSQYADRGEQEAFSYYSTIMRGTQTDAYIIYGQPVRSWKMIYRPFQWGYLFLSQGKGLAFFWCGRWIALFLVSLEMGRYLFQKKKALAGAYTFLITLSPIVQWWFAINGLVEMLVFGQLAVLLIKEYIRQTNYWKKFFRMLGIVWCGGTYILVFYPAWQVPIAYVYLFLLIGIIPREWKKENWHWKKDLPILACLFLLLGGSVGVIFYDAKDTILAVLNTVYPGSRVCSGGGAIEMLLGWPSNLFLPYKNNVAIGISNVCEKAGFISFFPLGLLLGLWVMVKEKKRDAFLISTYLGSLLLSAYVIFPWPVLLAKVTLLSHCQPERAAAGAAMLNLIVLLYAIDQSERKISPLLCVAGAEVIAVELSGYVYHTTPDVFETMIWVALMPVIALIAVAAAFFAIGRGKKAQYAFAAICVGVSVFTGATVNPVRTGVSVVEDNALVKAVKEVSKSDGGEGLWMSEDMTMPLLNVPLLAGAPTINCTNTYPVMERWEAIDTEKQYENVYNRYANFHIILKKDGEAVFKNPVPDQVELSMPVDDLKTLQISWILTKNDLEGLETDLIQFEKTTEVGNYKIYKVVCQS